MIRRLVQCALYLFVCTVLAAQQVPAAAVNSAASQTLPENPVPANADTAGWNRVGDLARGEEIHVAMAGGRSLHCLFAGATNEDLFCASQFSDHEFSFKRAEIENVRFNDERRNRTILISKLAIAGFGASFAVPRQPGDETPTVIRASIFGGVGALTGLVLSPFSHFIPGRLIYRRGAHDKPGDVDSGLLGQSHQQSP
jgi:hypothetical protein